MFSDGFFNDLRWDTLCLLLYCGDIVKRKHSHSTHILLSFIDPLYNWNGLSFGWFWAYEVCLELGIEAYLQFGPFFPLLGWFASGIVMSRRDVYSYHVPLLTQLVLLPSYLLPVMDSHAFCSCLAHISQLWVGALVDVCHCCLWTLSLFGINYFFKLVTTDWYFSRRRLLSGTCRWYDVFVIEL